jgi:hypothetical protein
VIRTIYHTFIRILKKKLSLPKKEKAYQAIRVG